MVDVKKIKTETLSEMYANAKTTYGQCGGHNKAARNKELLEKYGKELTDRGIVLETIPEGEFNGHGSS